VADLLPSFEPGFDYAPDSQVTSANLKQHVTNAAPRPGIIQQRSLYSAKSDPNQVSAEILLKDGDTTLYRADSKSWLNLIEDRSEGGRLTLGKDAGEGGIYNVFVGQSAGNKATGQNNTAIGSLALSKAEGYENTALGSCSMKSHQGSSSIQNTAVGSYALSGDHATANNWAARSNTAVGSEAGRYITTGDYNVAIGARTLMNADESVDCVAVGVGSLILSANGNSSIGIGSGSLKGDTNPAASIAIGTEALSSIEGSTSNVAIGHHAGQNSTSDMNVFVGTEAGRFSANGQNVAIGWKAMSNTTAGTYANCVAIGTNSAPTRSNQVSIGGTQTHVKLPRLPLNAAGLKTGELWVDNGVVKQIT